MQTLYCVGMPKQERILGGGSRSRWEAAGIALIVSSVVWFYGYLATSHSLTPFTFGKEPTDYYHYLVDGFLHGQLSLRVKPPPGLAALPDQYDPSARMRIDQPGWADMTYFKGRYYLYFGAAPAITLFLPFKVLTGLYFPESLACVVFCAGGYIASLTLFLAMRRRHFPECSTGIVWLGTLMLGMGNFCVVMLTRAQFYEVPISGAYCFSSCALLLLYYALSHGRRRRACLWLASAAFGLAVASRPNFVLASVVLGVAWLCLWRERAGTQPKNRRRELAWDAAALALPLAGIIAGLLIYNFERFDSPFNFGQKIQLSGSDQMHMSLLAWQVIPTNLYYYFWAPAQFGRFFPFVDIVRPYSGTPKVYYGVEDPFGILTNMPCFWLALAAPAAWLVYFRRRRAIGWMLVLCGACFAPVCIFELFFVSATNRYMVDFLPPLLLVSSAGLLMAGTVPEDNPLCRRLLGGFVAVLIVYTAFFNAMAAFQHNGLFRHHQPAAYDRIASWFNYPVGSWELLTHHPYGPVEMTVRLPSNALGSTQPLVVTGRGAHADFAYIYYTDSGSAQLGFSHLGDPAPVMSQPIALDYGVPHRISISMGSLYPPSTHPYFAHWKDPAVRAAKQTLRLAVDGVPYLETAEPFYEASPGVVAFGENPISDYAGRKFTGDILDIQRREPSPPAPLFAGGGLVRMAFVLPEGKAGRREPLLETGNGGAGDLLLISYEDDTHARLGFQHAGSELILSEPLAVVPGRIQLLEASLGSFYPATPDAGDLARALIVRFNGRLVWAQEEKFHPASPVAIGKNALTGDVCGPSFTGKLVAIQPMQPLVAASSSAPFAFDPYWVERGPGGDYGALRLHLELPSGRAGQFEPLLVSGPSVSQADYVWIQYLDSARIQIGYEHTSGGGPLSGAIPVDYSRFHVIEIGVPPLYPPLDSAYFSNWPLLSAFASKSRARVLVDGQVRMDAGVKGYESTPAQAAVGENRLSTTFGRKFTGRIFAVERETRTPPPGFGDGTGSLDMHVTWPEALAAGGREALLSTGGKGSRDVLFVSYEQGGTARLVVRSHGGKLVSGSSFPVSAGGGADLKISWGGLLPESLRSTALGADEWRRRQHSFVVEVNGAPGLSGENDFLFFSPQVVGVGSDGVPADAFSGSIRVAALRSPAP